jgi:hypothetical protein
MNKSLDDTVTKLAFSYVNHKIYIYIYPLSVSPNICKIKFKLSTNKCKSAEEKKSGNWRMTVVTKEN